MFSENPQKIETGYLSTQLPYVLMLAALLTVGLIRYHLVDIPLERDEGEYAYGGQIVLDGKVPYQYLYSMKMPGIYFAYAGLMSIFGQTIHGIHTGLLVINLLTTIAIFLLSRHFMSRMGAAVSAISFAFFSLSPNVEGVMANSEHFVIFFAVSGILLLIRATSTGRMYYFCISGLLLGAGCMMKQHGMLFCLFAILYLIYEIFQRRSLRLSCLWLLICGMLAIPLILLILIIRAGQFDTVWFWAVKVSQIYTSQMSPKEAVSYFQQRFFPIVSSAALFWTLAGIGLCLLWTSTTHRSLRVFLVLYVSLSFIAVCPGFFFRPHYFVLLLPSVSLLAGITMDIFSGFLTSLSSRWIRHVILLFVMAICIAQTLLWRSPFYFQMTPFQASRAMYTVNPFPETVVFADYIEKHTGPSDTVAIFGSEPQVFFYAKRKSATPHIYMYPLMLTNPAALEMQKEFLRDIETQKPKYVIFVNIPYSWCSAEQSYNILAEGFCTYQDKHLRMVATVELQQDNSIYRWGDEIQWPPASSNWMALFESYQ